MVQEGVVLFSTLLSDGVRSAAQRPISLYSSRSLAAHLLPAA